MCAHENMNMIAVGFQNGTVIVIRGNITRDRTSRVRIVHEEKGDRVYVTGNIHESSEGSSFYSQSQIWEKPLPSSQGWASKWLCLLYKY